MGSMLSVLTIKKCTGVRTLKSSGSVDIAQSSLEFGKVSLLVKTVVNSWKVRVWILIKRAR